MHAYKRNRHEPGNDSSAPPIRGPADGFRTDCDPQGHSFGWGFAGSRAGNQPGRGGLLRDPALAAASGSIYCRIPHPLYTRHQHLREELVQTGTLNLGTQRAAANTRGQETG